MLRIVIPLFLLLLNAKMALGQETRTKVEIISDERGASCINLQIWIEAMADSAVANFQVEGLEMLTGPIKTTSVAMEDGVYTKRETRLTYTFRPRRTGSFRFQSPLFFIDGRPLPNKTIEFKIEKIVAIDE